MARPAGQVIVRIDVDEIVEASGRAWDKAAKQVASEIDEHIYRNLSKRQSPPTSRPGQYPHVGQERGNPHLRDEYTVTGTRQGFKVYARVPHGLYLNEGTPNMAPRPWATKAMNARDWIAKTAKLAREFTGGSRRRSK